MEPITPNYQQEIAKLHYFIDLLIKENTQLKQLLQTSEQENAPGKAVLHNSLLQNKQNQPFLSNVQQDIGQNQPFPSNVQEDIGQNQPFPSNVQQDIGQNQSFQSNVQQDIGQNQPFPSNVQQDIGQKHSIPPVSPQGIATVHENGQGSLQAGTTKQVILQDIQQKIISNNINAHEVLKKLRTERLNATSDSLENSLKLLKHFALTPQNNYSALCRITGMSESGLSKHLSLLKKKGYIRKGEHKQFILTQKALQLLGS